MKGYSKYIYIKHAELIRKRFFNPLSYNEDEYYAQKEKFDKLFQFAIQYQDSPAIVDRLQETMQALKLCKDTMKSFAKVFDLRDEQTDSYLKELHIQIDEIFVMLTKDKLLARDLVLKLAARDEVKMKEFTHSGNSVSDGIIELIQIHDHIHGSLMSLVEGKI